MSPEPPAKAVVLGGEHGLLGRSLVAALRDRGATATPVSGDDTDNWSFDALAALLDREEPGLIINAVAYTQVDQAENEPQAAYRLNKSLPAMLAAQAKRLDATLAHYSTDFVFDGASKRPYTVQDAPRPLCVYGESKLAGERALLDSGHDKILIIRTAWLFGPGKMNFVRKMLDLASQRDSLSVVHDQTGSPTYTKDLAEHSLKLMDSGEHGVFHLVNAGKATWCELAQEAIRIAGLDCLVEPIPSSAFPQKAKRPEYSVLDTSRYAESTGASPRGWDQALRDYVFHDLEDVLQA